MLLEKPKQTPYIAVVKLSTGEELITRIAEADDDSITLDRPLQMMMGPGGAQFAPYLFMANPDRKFKVKRSHIIVEVEPNKQIEDQYMSVTSSIAITSSLPKSSILSA